MSLFEAIARNRAEWVAQGILKHAIEEDAGVRSAVAAAVAAPPPTTAHVREEVRDAGSQWRIDLEVEFDTVDELCRLELKLRAPSTRAQRDADRAGRVGLWIVPQGSHADCSPRITWAELAEAADDVVIKSLLREAQDFAVGWWLDEVSRDRAAELVQLFIHRDSCPDCGRLYPRGAAKAKWKDLTNFLSTVDARLKQQAWYRAGGWSASSKSRYFGFVMACDGPGGTDTRKGWIGFNETGAFCFGLGDEDHVLESTTYTCDDCEAWIIDQVGAGRR